MITRVLLALEPASLRRAVVDALEGPDVLVEVLPRRGRLFREVGRRSADVIVLVRSNLPDPPDEHLRTLRDLPDAPFLLVFVDDEDPEEQARLTAAGCHAVLNAATPTEALGPALRALIERRREEAPFTQELIPGPDDPRLSDFVSRSPGMQAFMDMVTRVVNTNTTLLFTGETGVGKERLARAIHAEGSRSGGPFVSVNCGALPEALLESELFGHEEGAFTGATRPRRGWFELAHGGTIFLDEIGEMPSHLQVKLLRVLQTREVQRVGGERSLPVDARIMAATNRELAAEIAEGRFRSDLYYRLSVVALELPPLRERREDIPILVDGYIRRFRTTFPTDVKGIEADALAALVRYDWPGNVRELMNIVERAMILCRGARITRPDLPDNVRGQATGAPAPGGPEPEPLSASMPTDWLDRPWREVYDEAIDDLERRYLIAQLEATRGRVGEAAARAGISPRSLYDKMRHHGIDKKRFRGSRDGHV